MERHRVGAHCDISIVGPGRVGTAIAVLAGRAGLRVAVGARSRDRAEAAAEIIGPAATPCTPAEAAAASDLVLLTVTDAAIETVCTELAESFNSGAVVAHCSGALDSTVLAAAGTRGCHTGSMHPLQTFPSAEAAGTYCFIEGSAEAAGALRELAERIGAKHAEIRPGQKALYHAAATMACNYVTALIDAAAAAAEQAGIDRATALAALGPIVRTTVANVFSMGPEGALTGPIARGECEIVRMHAEALASCPRDLQALYRAAAAWTIGLAERKGTINHAQADALRKEITLTEPKE